MKYREVVAVKGDQLGFTDICPFEVKLEPGTRPIYIPPRRIPHSQKKIVDNLVEEMLQLEVIQPSNSPWSAPLVLVRKKDGTMRPCVDYRAINAKTVPDRYPLPLINDIIQALGKARIFSVLDMMSGYWQMSVDPSSRDKTAFTTQPPFTPNFGMRNGVAAFSRLINVVLTGLIGNEALVYLDDIVVYSTDIPSHFVRLEKVLRRLQEHNLKIKLKKCHFFQREMIYLGHQVSARGIQPDPEKTAAVRKYPAPRNVDELRTFIGFIGYYRSFIPDFSSIAAPLTGLLKKNEPYVWGQEQESAFHTLKAGLGQEPLLIFPDYTQEFVLSTDASSYGLGAVLQQERDGLLRPIAFASKLMTKCERNYSVTEKEALALIWGLKKFRNIIYGYTIICITDHQALCHIFRNKSLEGRLGRWALLVQDYNPEIRYKPGRLNAVPDGLSRLRCPTSETSASEEDPLEMRGAKTSARTRLGLIDLDPEEIRYAQMADPFLARMLAKLETGRVKGWKLKAGIVFKILDFRIVLAVPDTLIGKVIALCHDLPISGHLGPERTLHRLKSRFFFPNMNTRVQEYCQTCPSCHAHKRRYDGKVPLFTYPVPNRPWDWVAMDILGPLPKSRRGYIYLLVFVDYLTRYVELAPLRSRQAEGVAEAIRRKLIRNHTTPEILISDNAAEFTSAIIQELSKLYGLKKVQISSYHPQSNGLVERQNAKVLSAIRHTLEANQRNWDDCLPDVQVAINSAYNSSLGDTPHYLLYHQDKRLPYDLLLSDDLSQHCSTSIPEYVFESAQRASEIFKEAKNHLEGERDKYLQQFNKEASFPTLIAGRRCFLRNIVKPGLKVKLAPKWVGPYRVMEDLGKGKIEVTEIATGRTKVVHRENVKFVPEDTVALKEVPAARAPYPSSSTALPSRDSAGMDSNSGAGSEELPSQIAMEEPYSAEPCRTWVFPADSRLWTTSWPTSQTCPPSSTLIPRMETPSFNGGAGSGTPTAMDGLLADKPADGTTMINQPSLMCSTPMVEGTGHTPLRQVPASPVKTSGPSETFRQRVNSEGQESAKRSDLDLRSERGSDPDLASSSQKELRRDALNDRC